MAQDDMSLRWDRESIASLMGDNGIRTRAQLATRLGRFGISRVMVYRVFSEDWNGFASVAMLASLAKEFGVALSQLVIEPASTKNRQEDNRDRRHRTQPATADVRRRVRPLQHRVLHGGVDSTVQR